MVCMALERALDSEYNFRLAGSLDHALIKMRFDNNPWKDSYLPHSDVTGQCM